MDGHPLLCAEIWGRLASALNGRQSRADATAGTQAGSGNERSAVSFAPANTAHHRLSPTRALLLSPPPPIHPPANRSPRSSSPPTSSRIHRLFQNPCLFDPFTGEQTPSSVARWVGDGVLAGVFGEQRRSGVLGRRRRRHGRRSGGAPAGHAPHPPAAASAARQPRDHRRAPRPRPRRRRAPRHPPRRGPRRALPRHERAARLRRLPECDGVPSVRDPVTVARLGALRSFGASLVHERGPGRRRHGGAANAHPVPGGARQDPAAAGSGGPQEVPAPRRRPPPRADGHGPRHPAQGGPPRPVPRPHGDRAPRRAGARRLLLDLRVRPGAPPPGLPPPRRRGREPRHHARRRRPRRRRQLGVLLPARRGQVAAPGADGVDGGEQVPRRGGLLPEERPGGGAPRAVARPRHRRRAGVRRQRRHLLRLRAGSALPGQRERSEARHGGELNRTEFVSESAKIGAAHSGTYAKIHWECLGVSHDITTK